MRINMEMAAFHFTWLFGSMDEGRLERANLGVSPVVLFDLVSFGSDCTSIDFAAGWTWTVAPKLVLMVLPISEVSLELLSEAPVLESKNKSQK